MERHGIAAVEDLIQHLISAQSHELSQIYNINRDPQYNIKWLQLLVTVDTIFVHEYLLFWSKPQDRESVCRYFAIFIFNDHTLDVRIERDLLLIGNQIPMSFLEKIAANNRNFSLAVFEMTVREFIVQRNPFFLSLDGRNGFLAFLESMNINLIDTREHLLDSLYFSCTVQHEWTRQTIPDDSRRKSVFIHVSPF